MQTGRQRPRNVSDAGQEGIVCRKLMPQFISTRTRQRMTNSDFDQFFTQRTAAAEAYVTGEPTPLDDLVTRRGAATFHSPRGDTISGADAVARRYREDAASFEPGGTSRFEILQIEASGDLAFWTGFQVAQVRLRGQPKPIAMRIRVSETFRRSDGEWKLIHRHADVPPGTR